MRYVDMTPTWEAVLPLHLHAIREGDAQGRKAAADEIMRLARFADEMNAEAKAQAPKPTGEEPSGPGRYTVGFTAAMETFAYSPTEARAICRERLEADPHVGEYTVTTCQKQAEQELPCVG